MQAPHDVIGMLYTTYPHGFARRFLGQENLVGADMCLRSFWANVPDADPRKQFLKASFVGRPGISSEAELWSRAVPISLHGDGVPVAGQSLEAITIAGVFGAWSSFGRCENVCIGQALKLQEQGYEQHVLVHTAMGIPGAR